MLWRNPIVLAVLYLFVLFSLINYKYWWASFINILIGFYFIAQQFPRQANHTNIEFFIETIILITIVVKIGNDRFKIPSILIGYLFRISVVTIYFFTGFHKLNADFLNPCVSCVNEVNEYILGNLTGKKLILSSNYSYFFQYGSIFIEMIVPFGLLWHQTRKYAAILLVLFHFYLNFAVYVDFSSLAAVLILGCCMDFEAKTINTKLIKPLKIYIFFTLFSILVKLFLWKINIHLYYLDFIYGCTYNIGWVIFFYYYFRNYIEKEYQFEGKYIFKIAICFVLLCFWTLKSYVGLGNAGNFTMFSNLVTEKTRSNHLLIDTKKTKLFNFEEDHLRILKLHDTLQVEKLENYKLPLIEFNYLSKKWCDKYPKIKLNATIVYQKDTLVINDLRKTKFIETKWWYHYLFFRKIQSEGANECYW